MIPLFKAYPLLSRSIPYIPLGSFPTPVERLNLPDGEFECGSLYIKRDDISGVVYGGNKVRKLEFLLAKALQAGAKDVVTFGYAGSNHALATAIYARQVGLKSSSMLVSQVNAHYLRRNLLAGREHGADLRHYRNWWSLTLGYLGKCLANVTRRRPVPTIIPPGGTCPLGVLGYINGFLELKQQIDAGEMPEPDFIYVPFGSMGTSAGLTFGLKLTGLKSRLVPVRVIETGISSAAKFKRLLNRTAAFLKKQDPDFPDLEFSDRDIVIRDDYLGSGYAHFTEEAMQSAALMEESAGIPMNGAYSAKAFAAIAGDSRQGSLRGKTVLFWNTYNSRDISAASNVSYRQLPKVFHSYFETEVQPLDRDNSGLLSGTGNNGKKLKTMVNTKKALITGASEGIGRVFAGKLAEEGFQITAVARNGERLEQLMSELGSGGHVYKAADLSTSEGINLVAGELKNGHYDLLINNAGSSLYAHFNETDLGKWENMIRLNCEAVMTLSHAFLRQARSGDALINVASCLAFMPLPDSGPYCATKAFVLSFTESLWFEHKKRGVYVMALCPGATSTEFHKRAGGTEQNLPPRAITQVPEKVVDAALKALRKRKKPTVICGPTNIAMTVMSRLMPRRKLVSMMGGKN